MDGEGLREGWNRQSAKFPVDGGVNLSEPREAEDEIFPTEVGDEEVVPLGVTIDGEQQACKVGDFAGDVLASVVRPKATHKT